ncbi:amidohydrolase family protein, partial [Amycolatopsis thailandensis]|uniref:amidohydrolase family protein n=1 Tax=Amycolatopsis thailandensis TaxID=589330 RepID=UPI00362AB20B
REGGLHGLRHPTWHRRLSALQNPKPRRLTTTPGPAWLEHAEGRKGTLAPGRLADLAVFDRDPLTAAGRDLLDARSVLTVLGGRVVSEVD